MHSRENQRVYSRVIRRRRAASSFSCCCCSSSHQFYTIQQAIITLVVFVLVVGFNSSASQLNTQPIELPKVSVKYSTSMVESVSPAYHHHYNQVLKPQVATQNDAEDRSSALLSTTATATNSNTNTANNRNIDTIFIINDLDSRQHRSPGSGNSNQQQHYNYHHQQQQQQQQQQQDSPSALEAAKVLPSAQQFKVQNVLQNNNAGFAAAADSLTFEAPARLHANGKILDNNRASYHRSVSSSMSFKPLAAQPTLQTVQQQQQQQALIPSKKMLNQLDSGASSMTSEQTFGKARTWNEVDTQQVASDNHLARADYNTCQQQQRSMGRILKSAKNLLTDGFASLEQYASSGNVFKLASNLLFASIPLIPFIIPDTRTRVRTSSASDSTISRFSLQGRVDLVMGWIERSVEHLPNFPRLHPQECVKRSICEAHNEPTKYGAIGFMLRLFFPATNLSITDRMDNMEYKVINKYRHAASYGLNKRIDNNGTGSIAVCKEKYEDCLVSLLEVTQNLLDIFLK